MRRLNFRILIAAPIITAVFLMSTGMAANEVVRPEEIKSKRIVIYDDATYVKLASMWKEYYKAYASEYAYANWMYAARYAGDKDYSELYAYDIQKNYDYLGKKGIKIAMWGDHLL